MKNVLGLFGFFVFFRVWEVLGEILKLHDDLGYK